MSGRKKTARKFERGAGFGCSKKTVRHELAKLSKKELIEMVVRLSEENARLNQRAALLEQKLDLVLRRLFGKSSEKLDPNQLELLLGLGEGKGGGETPAAPLAEEVPAKDAKAQARNTRRERIPENLPVEETVVDPKEVEADPEQWRLIGEEVSEQLDYEPGRMFRRRLVRRKYVRRGDADAVPVIAPLPPCLQERCIAGPGLMAAILVGKYADHLPLFRQEGIFLSRHEVYLPRTSMSRWVELAAGWLQPIYEIIRTGVMGGGYVQMDETPIRYLAPGNGQTKTGYLWTAHAPGGDVFYHWETSRGAHCLRNVIPADFRGKVQCDAYAAYPSFARDKKHIELLGCWAHARRHFHEAREHEPLRAAWVLHQIKLLYRVERRLRDAKAGPALRAAARASESSMIYKRIGRALVRFKRSGRHLPQSSFGKAVEYALSNWKQLGVYLGDGRLEIDNNLVENAIRPTAVGKKNWLFFGGAGTGQRSAILYTIIACCRRRGIDPFEYLRDVLTRIPYHTNHTVGELTPENWAKARRPLKAAA
jgi:transposase